MARIRVLKATFSLLVIVTALILLTLKYPSLTTKQSISSVNIFPLSKFVAIIIILSPIHSQFCHSQVYSQCLRELHQ